MTTLINANLKKPEEGHKKIDKYRLAAYKILQNIIYLRLKELKKENIIWMHYDFKSEY